MVEQNILSYDEKIKKIGNGSKGKVYLVRRGEELFVLKKAKTPEAVQSLKGEVEVMRGLEHSNIVKVVGSGEIDGKFSIGLEFC